VLLVSITELVIFYLPSSGSPILPGQGNIDSEYRKAKQVLKLARGIYFSSGCTAKRGTNVIQPEVGSYSSPFAKLFESQVCFHIADST
jgi:hypothetical protein